MKTDLFEELWELGKEEGVGLGGTVEQLVKTLEKAGISTNVQNALINVFSEIDAQIDHIHEVKLTIESFKIWHKDTYLKHRHLNDVVLVPETDPKTEG